MDLGWAISTEVILAQPTASQPQNVWVSHAEITESNPDQQDHLAGM